MSTRKPGEGQMTIADVCSEWRGPSGRGLDPDDAAFGECLMWLCDARGCDRAKVKAPLMALFERFGRVECWDRAHVLADYYGAKPADKGCLTSIPLPLLGLYEPCVDCHTLSDRAWAARHGMGARDVLRLSRWDYSGRGDHVYEEGR